MGTSGESHMTATSLSQHAIAVKQGLLHHQHQSEDVGKSWGPSGLFLDCIVGSPDQFPAREDSVHGAFSVGQCSVSFLL